MAGSTKNATWWAFVLLTCLLPLEATARDCLQDQNVQTFIQGADAAANRTWTNPTAYVDFVSIFSTENNFNGVQYLQRNCTLCAKVNSAGQLVTTFYDEALYSPFSFGLPGPKKYCDAGPYNGAKDLGVIYFSNPDVQGERQFLVWVSKTDQVDPGAKPFCNTDLCMLQQYLAGYGSNLYNCDRCLSALQNQITEFERQADSVNSSTPARSAVQAPSPARVRGLRL